MYATVCTCVPCPCAGAGLALWRGSYAVVRIMPCLRVRVCSVCARSPALCERSHTCEGTYRSKCGSPVCVCAPCAGSRSLALSSSPRSRAGSPSLSRPADSAAPGRGRCENMTKCNTKNAWLRRRRVWPLCEIHRPRAQGRVRSANRRGGPLCAVKEKRNAFALRSCWM